MNKHQAGAAEPRLLGVYMKIRIWDNGGSTIDRYTILIDKHLFYMSMYPDRANEVNMYARELKHTMNMNAVLAIMKHHTPIRPIPKTLRYAIRERCKQIRRDENES